MLNTEKLNRQIKKDPQRSHTVALMKWIHIAISIVIFTEGWLLFFDDNGIASRTSQVYLPLFFAFFYYWLTNVFDSYILSFNKPMRISLSLGIASTITFVFAYLVICLIAGAIYEPICLAGCLVAQLVFNVFWAYLADALYYFIHKPLKTMVVYGTDSDLDRVANIHHFTRKYSITKSVQIEQLDLEQDLKDVEAVFVIGVSRQTRDEIARKALVSNILTFFTPDISDVVLINASENQFYGTPLLSISLPKPDFMYQAVKRCFDFTVALMAIILVSPIMIGAALAIKIKDPGPIFFKQVRIGRNLKPFNCYKFRTMSVKAPVMHPNAIANVGSYLTPLGAFLRSSSIDELPQLLNVLLGDMSFIGPRPIPGYEEELIKKRASMGIYQLRPGLSGLAQVSGRNGVNDTEKLMFDYQYLSNISAVLDMKIFFKTILFVFARVGIFSNKK